MPGQLAAPAAAAAPRCSTSDLTAWIGVPGDGAAGTTAYQLELSNTSHHTCTLTGFPGVSAVGLGGHRLGRAAGRDHSDPTRLVTLRRGATAHVVTGNGSTPKIPILHPGVIGPLHRRDIYDDVR